MNTQLLLSNIVILSFPIILALALWTIKSAEQKLPEKQRTALDQFVKYAVYCVEQTSNGTSMQKKNAAITLITAFFAAMKLPMPSQTLVEAAIEACVFEMKQARIPDEFFDGDKRAINTGPIKPVSPPAPDPGGTPV